MKRADHAEAEPCRLVARWAFVAIKNIGGALGKLGSKNGGASASRSKVSCRMDIRRS